MEKTFTTSPLTLVFDLKTQKQVKAFAGDGREDLVALFSSDGEKLACGAKGGVITVWDARTGSEARRLSGHTDSVDVLTFCSGERLLVSGGWDKTVRVWNVDLGEQIAWMPYSDRIIAIWSDPKGRQILVADGGGPSNVPNIDCIELVGVPVHDRREAPRDPSESRASRWWRRIRVR